MGRGAKYLQGKTQTVRIIKKSKSNVQNTARLFFFFFFCTTMNSPVGNLDILNKRLKRNCMFLSVHEITLVMLEGLPFNGDTLCKH